jgi:hypothetical protein
MPRADVRARQAEMKEYALEKKQLADKLAGCHCRPGVRALGAALCSGAAGLSSRCDERQSASKRPRPSLAAPELGGHERVRAPPA